MALRPSISSWRESSPGARRRCRSPVEVGAAAPRRPPPTSSFEPFDLVLLVVFGDLMQQALTQSTSH